MKKMFLLVALLSGSLFAELTPEQMAVEIGSENVTSNDLRFAEFMEPTTINGNERVLVSFAWLRIPVEMLDVLIPKEFIFLRWGIVLEDDIALRDFLLLGPVDLGDGACLVQLCSKDPGGSRRGYMSSWYLEQWVAGIQLFGFVEADILNKAERNALFPE